MATPGCPHPAEGVVVETERTVLAAEGGDDGDRDVDADVRGGGGTRDGGGRCERGGCERPMPSTPQPTPMPPSISDFRLGAVIGEGSYGRVCHARLKGPRRGRGGVPETDDSGGRDGGGGAGGGGGNGDDGSGSGGDGGNRDLAMKMVEKREVAKYGRLRSVMAERDALTSFALEAAAAEEGESVDGDDVASASAWKSQFVIRLRACFHGEDHLFFVMDLCWETLEDAVAKVHNNRAGENIEDEEEDLHRSNDHLRLRSDAHTAGDDDGASSASNGDTPVRATCTTIANSPLRRMAQYYLGQILLGLEFVHSRGIVHRDVKPSNVLIAPRTGAARLADFGSSCSVLGTTSGDEGDGAVADGGDGGGIAGTAGYAPPELISGGDASRSTTVDLWSLGCVAHHVLVGGGSPFESGSECLTVRRIMSYARGGRGGGGEGGSFQPLEAGGRDDDEASDLIRRLLHPDPGSRLGAGDLFDGDLVGAPGVEGGGGRRRGGTNRPPPPDATYHSIRSHPFFDGRGAADGRDCDESVDHRAGSGDWWTKLEGGGLRPPYRPDVPKWLGRRRRPRWRAGGDGDSHGDGSPPPMRDGATEFGRWLMENG